MKKPLIFVLFIIMLLCSCAPKEQNNMKPNNNSTVTVINKVKDADIWILPETKENLKTTLWGTPTASKVKTGEKRQAPLCEAGDNGHYILRMIDTDKFYYSANKIIFKNGWTLTIKEDEYHSITLEVTDENNNLNNTYEVFSARL